MGLTPEAIDGLAQFRIWDTDAIDDLGALSLGYLCTHIQGGRLPEHLFERIAVGSGFPANAVAKRITETARECAISDPLPRVSFLPWAVLSPAPHERGHVTKALGAMCSDSAGRPESVVLSATPTVPEGLLPLTKLYATAVLGNAPGCALGRLRFVEDDARHDQSW